MKAILIICILLASILFSPSSIIARELAQSGTSQTGNSKNPAIKPDGLGRRAQDQVMMRFRFPSKPNVQRDQNGGGKGQNYASEQKARCMVDRGIKG